MVDILTIVGLIVGFGTLVIGIMIRLDIRYYIDLASFLITFGTTAGATLASFSTEDVKNMPATLMNAFRKKSSRPAELVSELSRYAEIARRDGILALEGVAEQIQDEFLVKGLQLAVDGTDPEQIQSMLAIELENVSERHEKGREFLLALADYAPACGMIGTIIGLIAMLVAAGDSANMSQMASGFALALLTTLYGVCASYLILRPLAKKLEFRSNEEILNKEMIIRGVMAIQSGDNPRVVEQKLIIFLAPKVRKTVSRKK